MTDYDMSTLDGALLQLGKKMSSNLIEKGVKGTVEDGLNSLAEKISLISVNEVFDLSINENIVEVGSTVTFTSHVSPFEDDMKVELYKNGAYVEDMINKSDGVYESNIVCDEEGVFSFHGRIDDKITETVKVTVRSPSNLKITGFTGLRTSTDPITEYVYDGDEFTVNGILTDSNNNPIPNEPINIVLQYGSVGESVTNENGEFSVTVINPYYPYSAEFNDMTVTAKYTGNDIYYLSQDSSIISYRHISTTDLPNSFKYLTKLINQTREGDTLHLTHDYEYSTGDSTTGVIISKLLTINGHGHSIDCKESSKIFSCTKGATLKELNIINARQTNNNGGAITHTNGNLNLINCNFDNCQAKSDTTYFKGGAIYSTGADLIITNSNFNNCQGSFGGAIYKHNNGVVSIIDSSFTNCAGSSTAGSEGGGALLIYDVTSLIVDNCRFINNIFTPGSGTYSGGGAGFLGASNGCNIVNSYFENNEVSYSTANHSGGGALWIGTSTGNVTNCIFINNSANRAGAIFNRVTGTVSGCLFLNNYAESGSVACGGMDSGTVYYKDNIVLNSTGPGSYVIFNTYAGTLDCSDNWYGSNSTNKNTKPGPVPGGAVTLSKWMYLTPVIDKTSINVDETSKILLNLYNYATTSSTGYYDAIKTPITEFDIECTKGELSKDKITLNRGMSDIIGFTGKETGTAQIIISKNNVIILTIEITIN